jgi:caa(3)-type oxidase subunit IV
MTGDGHRGNGQTPGGGGVFAAIRTGWMVFVALAVLTIVEYIVAVGVDANLPVVAVIALAKAGLIIYYFMHVVRAWRGEAGH